MPKYEITTQDRVYPVSDEEITSLDIIPTGSDTYHLLREGKTYTVEVVHREATRKILHLRINGRMHHLAVSDATDLLVKHLGFAVAPTSQSKNILAPMPGLVLEVMVNAGDRVSAGTPLLILEAMKMENVLKAESDGQVKAITVTKGEAVNKRQLLIEVE